MQKYLLQTSMKYRVENEKDAEELIKNAKLEHHGSLNKYNCIYKNQKQKGEIVQDWYEVTLVIDFNDAKEPNSLIDVTYEVD